MSIFKHKCAPYVVSIFPLLLGGLYTYYSDIFYNSDYALIGLLAKRIAETGQQFIFVPKAGYQGLLLEGNAVALCFKIFGISLTTLNFAPLFFYFTFFIAFYHTTKLWHGKIIAVLSTLFMALSTPCFYSQVVRTQPNYGETYTMGMLLFYLYGKIIKNPNQSHKLRMLIGGLIGGFGYYTYGQIVFFIGVIGVHLILQAIQLYKNTSDKPRWVIRGNKFFVRYLLFWLIMLLADFKEFYVGEQKISWSILSNIFVGLFLWGQLYIIFALVNKYSEFKKWIPSVLL